MTDAPQQSQPSDDQGSFAGGTSAVTAIGAKTKLLVAYAAAALGVKVTGLDQEQSKGNERGK